jgi:hypothetical protein
VNSDAVRISTSRKANMPIAKQGQKFFLALDVELWNLLLKMQKLQHLVHTHAEKLLVTRSHS